VLKAVELQQKKLFEQYTDIGQISKEFARSLSQGLEDALIAGKSLSDVLKQLAQDLLRIITQQLITKPFEKAIGDIAFSYFGSGGTQPPAPITVAGTRAAGGPVGGNMTYLVGEEGPELFVPSTSGTIIPNDAMSSFSAGGSKKVTQVFNITTPNADSFRLSQRQIARNAKMGLQT